MFFSRGKDNDDMCEAHSREYSSKQVFFMLFFTRDVASWNLNEVSSQELQMKAF
jgi:hypothetical protein